MATVFSDEEISVVRTRYPEILRRGPDTVEGSLNMRAIYNEQLLSDVFRIRITATNPNSDSVPALYEIGGRTQAIAKRCGLSDLRSLHRNVDGSACVCVKQLERKKFPSGSDLFVFVEKLAVPYLYGLISYEPHQQWPWGDHSHGGLGLLEFYALDPTLPTADEIVEIVPFIRKESNWKDYHKQLRKPSAERACLCGSGRPFQKCHRNAWQGLANLHRDLLKQGIEPRTLFS